MTRSKTVVLTLGLSISSLDCGLGMHAAFAVTHLAQFALRNPKMASITVLLSSLV